MHLIKQYYHRKGIRVQPQRILPTLLVLFIVVASTRLWSFRAAPASIFPALESLNVLLLIGILVYNYNSPSLGKGVFTWNVLLFILIPMIGIFPASVFHNQPYVQSLLALKVNFLWLLYFVLHVLQVPVKRLVQIMIFMGGVWVLLTVVQQFTYPTYFFATRDEETSYDFFRAGVYRFMVDDHHYGLFLLLFFFYRFLLTRKAVWLLPVLFGLVGFYYYGTRQFALAALFCMVVAALAQKGRMRAYAVIGMVVVGIVVISLSSVLFAGYIEMTKQQVGSAEEDIRQQSAAFYFSEYWPHWITRLTGNGLEHPESQYGREIAYLNNPVGFYRTDVGIIGAFNLFGIFHVLNILLANVKGMLSRYYLKEDNYLRLFFLNALLLVVISEYYTYSSTIPFFCILFYMVDKANEKRGMVRFVRRVKKMSPAWG